jgi:cytochrome c oxidase subunit I+III
MSTTEGPVQVTEEQALATLNRTWEPPTGFVGWFMPVNHRIVGKRFLMTAWAFMLIGGIEALLMRIQLAYAQNDFLNPDLYNQIFTMHGITMMFLFGVPIGEAYGIYLVPLMIGTRDMVFPRLNAFGYYVFLLGGVILYIGLMLNSAPDAGWFNYPPLSNAEFSPDNRIDLYSTLITFIEIAALVAALELVVTIFKQRAPGMSLNRMPLFVWAILVMALMIIFAMPAVMVSSMMLAVDREVGTHIFAAQMNGGPVLWQHLFGSSAILRFTSSLSPPLESSQRLSRRSPVGRFTGTRPWSCRWSLRVF